jgi:hypothetical protein
MSQEANIYRVRCNGSFLRPTDTFIKSNLFFWLHFWQKIKTIWGIYRQELRFEDEIRTPYSTEHSILKILHRTFQDPIQTQEMWLLEPKVPYKWSHTRNWDDKQSRTSCSSGHVDHVTDQMFTPSVLKLTFCVTFDHLSYPIFLIKKISYILLWFVLPLKKIELWLIIYIFKLIF